VRDEKFEITNEGVFRFEGTGSYRDQRDIIGRYTVDLQVCCICYRGCEGDHGSKGVQIT
jgi:hypothetical protein